MQKIIIFFLETEENNKLENILSNRFGFSGKKATLLMSKYDD